MDSLLRHLATALLITTGSTAGALTAETVPQLAAGGTFTLTSMGRRAVSVFQTPILNQPEAAILATGGMIDKPVVRKPEQVGGKPGLHRVTLP